MARSSESEEWHLTPRGWVAGTSRTDSGVTTIEPPEDRVLTVLIGEDMDSGMRFSKYEHEIWPLLESRDTATIARLRNRFGERPGGVASDRRANSHPPRAATANPNAPRTQAKPRAKGVRRRKGKA